MVATVPAATRLTNRMRPLKSSIAIIIAAFVFVLGVFAEADSFPAAIHPGYRTIVPSATHHASGIRTLGCRHGLRSLFHGGRYRPIISRGSISAVHYVKFAEFVFCTAQDARSSSAARPFSARPPPGA